MRTYIHGVYIYIYTHVHSRVVFYAVVRLLYICVHQDAQISGDCIFLSYCPIFLGPQYSLQSRHVSALRILRSGLDFWEIVCNLTVSILPNLLFCCLTLSVCVSLSPPLSLYICVCVYIYKKCLLTCKLLCLCNRSRYTYRHV